MNLEQKYYYPWSQIKQNQPTKQDINKKYKQIADQFINSQHPDLKRSINKQIQDYTTESNDNTKVNNVQHRQYNQHLKQRTIAGAKSNALWEKEHPTLSTLGYTAAAAPFVVASAPALIPAGDALAGSAVGNGISSILTNPYFNAVITASGGADAANKIYHGEYGKSPVQDAFTVLEMVPFANQALKFSNGYDPISSYIKGNYRFLKDHGLSKAALYGAGRLGNNYARSKIISQTLNDGVDNAALKVSPTENVGWFPKQTIEVSHASNTDQPLKLYFPERWDAKQEGANPLGIWFQGKLGTARTDLTNPGKGTKAFNARQLFADRPFHYKADLTLNKPIGTVGEVSDRSALSRKAEDLGSDGIIYNDVYDNGYNHNQVILSFKEPNASSNSFKSELDWSPESWFKHKYTQSVVEALNSHLAEYKQIEQEAKKNGTWLKMKDGSTWQGDPRSWVQLQSKDGSKLAQQEHQIYQMKRQHNLYIKK